MAQPVGPAATTADPELRLAATVARLFYLERRSKLEIGEQLEISRFKVARLLNRAHDLGLVHIQIRDPHGVDVELSDRLAAALGIERAFVLATADDPRSQVGVMAARYLADTVTPGQVVGIAWSRSTQALVERLDGLPRCTVVQLCGVIQQTTGEEHNVELVRRAATAAHGTAVTFYAPLVVADAPTAKALRQLPGIADALETCDALDVAVVAVGQWTAGESTVYDALPPEERALFARRGAVVESCGLLLTADGRPVRDGLQRRVVAVTEAQLRRTPDVVALATGDERVEAVRAITRSGIVTTLITHRSVAERLLAD